MSDADGDELSRRPVYVVRVRIRDDGADVALWRTSDAEGCGNVEDVWSHPFSSLNSAQIVAHLMMRRSERWPTWARMALLLGSDFLTGVIENEVVGAAREEPAAGLGAGGADDPEDLDEQATVFFSLMLEGGPRLVGIRSRQRFLNMEFDTAVAALRVWDWVRWQSHAFAGWHALAKARGSIALEIMILDSTRLAERQARSGGYAAEGPRPLRNWHPDPPAGDPD